MLEFLIEVTDRRLGDGSDALNTAIRVARMGVQTAYMTAQGNDGFWGDV